MEHQFSKNIVTLRKDRKLSQKQVAADLKISQALLSHYENGIRECGLDFLVKIATYYDVSSDYLLGITSEHDNTNKKVTDEKTIVSSITILYSVLKKINSKILKKEVTHFFSCAVYTIFRYICKGDESIFSLDKDVMTTVINSKMEMSKANITLLTKKQEISEHIPSVPFKEYLENETSIKKLIDIAEK